MKKTFLLPILALIAIPICGSVHAQGTLSNPHCDSSRITYRITHPLHVVEAISQAAVFRLAVDTLTKQIKNVSASVDVMTFDSGNSNRDSHAMETIDALTYPDARFSSTDIVQHNDTLSVGGSLLFHGVTKPVRLNAISRWTARELSVDGTFALSLTAFAVERPSMLMLPVEDTLRFTFHAAFHLK